MKRIATVVIWLTVLAAPAVAQVFQWRDGSGRAEPDTEARKAASGFGAWLFTTSDADWEAKWNTPQEVVPHFTEAHSVRKGERIVTLIFIVNPSRDASGNVSVRCDIHITRPDGTVSVNERDFACMEGMLEGDPLNMHLAALSIPFVGEEGDAEGTWITNVTLRDVGRNTTMNLRSSFEYVGDG